ncbi:MAG: hypothetical protein JW959_02500 [Pirellulales bacterium]|nr:hypothetical protein [Pirellulales bacterium]
MTSSIPTKPRVGVLAVTLELYERLAPSLRREREAWFRIRAVPALESIAEVRFSNAVYRREDLEALAAEHETAGCDALLVVCLTYAPSQMLLPALRRTRLPIFLWNTQELFAVDDAFDGDRIIHNHGVHGTQDLANVLLRSGVPFHYATSHLSDRDALRDLDGFLSAAAAVSSLRRCRLGLLGYPFPGMGDFAIDTTHLAATLGCCWQPLPVEEYIHRARAAPKADVDRLKEEYRRSYAVAADVGDADLDGTARAEASLRSMVAEYRLDALSFQFLALGEDERTETLPFVAVSRMMAEGIGFAGEGDLVGAAGVWFLNRLRPPASFSEIFTIDFAGDGVLLSHMGEANIAMARKDGQTPLAARSTPIARTRGRQLALITRFAPGPATLCALALGPRNRWRLIVSLMEIPDCGELRAMQVPYGKIRNRRNVRDWLTAYALAGGPHHQAICFGDARPRLKIAAALLDADYIEV